MTGDTALDHFELQLTPPCTSISRCELYICANGQRERLASGFLKQFLTHIRAARELYTGGSQATIRLRRPPQHKQQQWFKRETLERFVRFVSTPEVLERVKTIEDELIQLEQVRSIQVNSLGQKSVLDTDLAFSGIDAIPATGLCQDMCGQSTLLGLPCENEADRSKKELLRAMDVRLLALRQEQSMAFSRAAAAGFDMSGIKDLMDFSEFYGAERLRAACIEFFELSRKRPEAPDVHVGSDSNAVSSSSDMSLSSASGLDLLGEMEAYSFVGLQQSSGLGAKYQEEEVMSSSLPKSPDAEVHRRWDPLRAETGSEESEVVSAELINQLETIGNQSVPLSTWEKQNTDPSSSPPATRSKGVLQRSISPKRRSVSPLRRIQIGRSGFRRCGSVAIRNINYFSSQSNGGGNTNNVSCSSDSEYEDEQVPTIEAPTPIRSGRLSVQAAINLFESKQQKVPAKQCQTRQTNCKGLPEGSVLSSQGSSANCIGVCSSAASLDNEEWSQIDQAESYRISSTLSEVDACKQMVDYDLQGVDNETNLQAWKIFQKDACRGELMRVDSLRKMDPDGVAVRSSGNSAMHSPSNSGSSRSTLTDQNKGSGKLGKPSSNYEVKQYDHTVCSSEVSSLSVISQVNPTENPSDQSCSGSEASLDQRGRSMTSKGGNSMGFDELYLKLDKESYVTGRESLGSSWIVPSDLGMQALVKLVDHPIVDDESHGRQEGRFYEQYRKLRDAKLIEEQHSKRAEREAKLKVMKETLDLRKAEMDARASRFSKKNNHSQSVNARLGSTKEGVYNTNKELEDERQMMEQVKDKRNTSSNIVSPLKPCAAKEQVSTSKITTVKKASGVVQKHSRISSQASSTVSSRSIPKSKGGAFQRQSVTLSVTDNPLARSVPCFGDLRKENTKPLSGQPPTRSFVKIGEGTGWLRPANDATDFGADSNLIVHSVSQSRIAKADKKNRNMVTRKGYVASEPKVMEVQDEEGVLAPLRGQRDAIGESTPLSKIRRSAVAPIQEVKPFLRKGCGIGPGKGPGVMKLKASSMADTSKNSDDDTQTYEASETLTCDQASAEVVDISTSASFSTLDNVTKVVLEDASQIVQDISNVVETNAPLDGVPCSDFTTEGMQAIIHAEGLPVAEVGSEMDVDATAATDADATHHSADLAFVIHKGHEKSEGSFIDEDLLDNERACHTISFPIDFETRKRYATTFEVQEDCASQQQATCQAGGDSSTLSQLIGSGVPSATESRSHTSNAPPLASTATASPCNSSTIQPCAVSDRFSPPSAVAVESLLFESPASWNSSQVHYASEAELGKSRKKWGGSRKSASGVSRKEPAKGLKRLLNFARKSRPVEITSTENVSVSVTSDDSEELSGTSNRSTKLERILKESAGHPLQSSIPVPPSNFKLRDERVLAGSSLRAPRSFFSLSTFRSRGEGKSR